MLEAPFALIWAMRGTNPALTCRGQSASKTSVTFWGGRAPSLELNKPDEPMGGCKGICSHVVARLTTLP